MTDILKQNGYNTFSASDGQDALTIFDEKHIDMLVSDIMMPNVDGFELTKLVRQSYPQMPILLITAKETFDDKKRGFLNGADDYMVKPIDINEMILRVSSLLRRAGIANEHRMVLGNVILDYDSLSVQKHYETITLPPKEFFLLFMLLSYPNIIFTRRQLLDEIWGMDHDADERTVDVHIKRLRERFYNYNEFEIVTIRGLGYKAIKKVN
jgi:DNA-binding response OmpR family regulator